MLGVSCEAQKALAPLVTVIGGELLWKVFSTSTLPHVRRNVLYLFTTQGKWDGRSSFIYRTTVLVKLLSATGCKPLLGQNQFDVFQMFIQEESF